jgi:phage head maturation protease
LTAKFFLTAPVEIQAASGEGKRPTFSIAAYTGNVMNVAGFYSPIIVDLAGLKAAGQELPILRDHDPGRIIGQSDKVTIDAQGVTVTGVVTGDDSEAASVTSHAKNGFKWKASIGASVIRREFVEAGKSVTVNGRQVAGPVIIARESELQEVSFVAIGADKDARANVAAQQHKQGQKTSMTFEQYVESMGFEVATLTADQRAGLEAAHAHQHGQGRALTAEAQRVADIESIDISRYPRQRDKLETVKATAIENGWDLNRTELEIFRSAKDIDPRGSNHHRHQPGYGSREVVEATLLRRAGKHALAEKHYNAQVLYAADQMRASSFVDLCGACLRIDGRETGGMSRHEMITAAFSTTSLPVALSNVTGKSLWQAYDEATTSWRGFAKVLPAADFKPQQGIRPSFVGQLEEVGGTSEVKHGQLAESTYPWQISTFAKQLQVSRKDVINDDLSFIDQTAPLMAKMAARTLNDLVWSTILGNAGAFFHANNANLLEAGSLFGLTSLGSAVTAMRTQRDAHGNDIDITPRVLAVPPELEVSARAALNSEEVQATAGSPMGNALQNIAALVVESRLSNSAKFMNASAAGWYLFGGVNDAPVIVGFLDGQERQRLNSSGLIRISTRSASAGVWCMTSVALSATTAPPSRRQARRVVNRK